MTSHVRIFDGRSCSLGEGPLWHPLREQLFWFDIENYQLLSRKDDDFFSWRFDRQVSAAGWIDINQLLIASETGLSCFDLNAQTEKKICAIEADNSETRSNDGRADPWGGFWVGTMSKTGGIGHGRLYRWYKGELKVLASQMTTPNAICFDRARARAYYADTKARTIWCQPLDQENGWPIGEKFSFIDLSASPGSAEHKPDGAVVDSEGCIWNAQWGSARVARYNPDGHFLEAVDLPTGHVSCPAFGGTDLNTLFVTTATQKLPADKCDWLAHAGKVFSVTTRISGCTEPRVRL